MLKEERNYYLAIDLKSFYASVECMERGLDPLGTNLVVADASRTEKTICLAVSPSLKARGVPGRPRLYQVVQQVNRINAMRRAECRGFTGKSYLDKELKNNPSLELDYIVAKPRMAYYIQYSNRIYDIYLKYVAPEDIVVYSIDEVFINITPYMNTYQKTAHEIAMMIIKDVLKETGITATAGIGTNLYLAKIAMDIVAKNMPADKDGVRIAELNQIKYRELMWSHEPITDFWRVGKGYAKKLYKKGLYTMGDIARCSIGEENSFYNEDLLYRLFGKNAELLIDHAWGYEPCTMADIKAYRPETNSIGSGQVLQDPYKCESAKLVTWEMTDLLVLDLVDKGFVTNQMVLTVGYDITNLTDPSIEYSGEITTDAYGREIPKHAHGTVNLDEYTSSSEKILDAVMDLYDRIVNPQLLIRRINITACRVIRKDQIPEKKQVQLSIFDVIEENKKKREPQETEKNTHKHREDKKGTPEEEKALQETMLNIKKKYGKNALIKGANLQEGATARDRNSQIGGHKA